MAVHASYHGKLSHQLHSCIDHSHTFNTNRYRPNINIYTLQPSMLHNTLSLALSLNTPSPLSPSSITIYLSIPSNYWKWCGKSTGPRRILHSLMMQIAQIMRPVRQFHPRKNRLAPSSRSSVWRVLVRLV